MFRERQDLYRKLEAARESKLLVYVTSNRQNMETRIAPDVVSPITDHLDAIGDVPKITLYLHTNGGDTMASWSIANLIRQFCKTFEVIVAERALSGGTLISLGADQIVMTKQAALGPIDPSVNHPLNPQVPGQPGARVPVSVEAINGYLDFLRDALKPKKDLVQHALNLAQQIHPLVLGQVYRTRSQIRMLGQKLLDKHVGNDGPRKKKILDFLCSESGSHDYTINRQEASAELGLNVQKPDADTYGIIKAIHDDIRSELELGNPYDVRVFMGGHQSRPYAFRRGLVESLPHGTHCFISEGTMVKQQAKTPTPQGPQELIQDSRSFEGWKHEPAQVQVTPGPAAHPQQTPPPPAVSPSV